MKAQTLEYQGYFGSIEADTENSTLHGTVQGLRDVITYEATTVKALAKEFRKSIDAYLKFCDERGKAPDRPYSGKVLARFDPDLHRKAASLAEARGVSLNDLIVEAVEHEIENPSRVAG